DDGAGLLALWQPGPAAGDAADAVRVFVLSGGPSHGASRRRVARDDAAGRDAHRHGRPTEAARPGARHRWRHAHLARTAESERRVLGNLLAPTAPGCRAGAP